MSAYVSMWTRLRVLLWMLIVVVLSLGCTEVKQWAADASDAPVQADSPLPMIDEPVVDSPSPPDNLPPADAPVPPQDSPITSCSAGETLCDMRCVNTMTNASNCGTCGLQCAPGQSCVNGSCSSSTMDLREPGRACTRSSDCPGMDGFCIPELNGWRGGFCAYSCLGSGDPPCPTASTCLRYPGSARGVCLRTCTDSTSCRTDYVCTPVPGGSVSFCSTSCEGSAAPAGPIACDATGSLCVPGCSYQCSTSCAQPNMTCNVGSGSCGCANDTACGAEYHCDASTGRCLRRS